VTCVQLWHQRHQQAWSQGFIIRALLHKCVYHLVITHEPPYLTEGWAAQTSGVLTYHRLDIPKTSYKKCNYKYAQRQGWKSLALIQMHTVIYIKANFPSCFPAKLNLIS